MKGRTLMYGAGVSCDTSRLRKVHVCFAWRVTAAFSSGMISLSLSLSLPPWFRVFPQAARADNFVPLRVVDAEFVDC